MLTVKSLGYEFLQRRKRDVPTIRMFRVWKWFGLWRHSWWRSCNLNWKISFPSLFFILKNVLRNEKENKRLSTGLTTMLALPRDPQCDRHHWSSWKLADLLGGYWDVSEISDWSGHPSSPADTTQIPAGYIIFLDADLF